MIINTEIVDAYLNGEDISKYSSLFIYRQADRNIFQEPKKDKAEIVTKIKDEIINHIRNFIPCNKRIWDTLFKDWQNDLDDIVLDLVVGCKEPNDAFVLKDLNGRHHMVFDLLCWEKLEDIYIQSINKMKLALMETNPQSQEQYIYEANFGDYYDKCACMCGMLYLAKQW